MQEKRTAVRRLAVMRHAKAESSGVTDHARELAAGGHAAAAEAGRWLASRLDAPAHVLVSDAVRTQQTWEEVAVAAGWPLDHDPCAALFAAGPETALDLIRGVPANVETLVVIGHNPTVAFLVELLDDGDGDQQAIDALVTTGYPPGTVTVFDVAVEWADLGESKATVAAFHVGQP